MFLIKLGGSVITDKATEGVFKPETVHQLAGELAAARKSCILVHGAGSFGHVLAKFHRLNDGLSFPSQTLGFSRTQASVQTLNCHILNALLHHNLPIISLPPHAILTLDDHRLKTMDYGKFETALANGFIPVTYGDVAFDDQLKGSVCSGDLLMRALAAHFKPEKVIFVMDEDGLYTANPKTHPDARFIDHITLQELPELSTELDTRADVTKGMQGKLETIASIASLGIDVILLNGNIKNRLHDTLVGRQTRQTLIEGARL